MLLINLMVKLLKRGPAKGCFPWNKGLKCPQISKSRKGQPVWNKGLTGIKTSNKGQISSRKLPQKIIICRFCLKTNKVKINSLKLFCNKKCFINYQKTPEYKSSQREKAYHRKRNCIESSPEKFFSEILKANNISYKKGKNITGNPDFIIGNLCVFIDGEYWHNYPNLRDIDIENNKKLEQLGFIVLRFWVNHEFYKNPSKCFNKIIANLGVEPSISNS